MTDFSLVPVDHQPDFGDVSLIPVDQDPFGSDRTTQQLQIQQAQAPPGEPQSPLLVAPSEDYNRPIGAQLPELADESSAYNYASLAPSLNDDPKADSPYWPKSSKTGSNQQQLVWLPTLPIVNASISAYTCWLRQAVICSLRNFGCALHNAWDVSNGYSYSQTIPNTRRTSNSGAKFRTASCTRYEFRAGIPGCYEADGRNHRTYRRAAA